MMLELLSNNIPFVLSRRQIWSSRRLSHCVWDKHENAPAVEEIASHTRALGVGPVCLGRRQFICRRSPGLLLTNT
ncbi:hypothetical protein TNCV_5070191 [Trichonephila clavipes]|nr:hypothetical protein TNCV_5070191 [Trichonephila clavipes]